MSPAWSPTGEWIAFSGRAHRQDKLDIFLVDVTGNQVRQLTHGEGSNENPVWSPDGRFLAFISTRSTPDTEEAKERRKRSIELVETRGLAALADQCHCHAF